MAGGRWNAPEATNDHVAVVHRLADAEPRIVARELRECQALRALRIRSIRDVPFRKQRRSVQIEQSELLGGRSLIESREILRLQPYYLALILQERRGFSQSALCATQRYHRS